MKLAITGSNGFIGRHLLEFFLEKNFHVVGMQRIKPFVQKNLSFFYYDLENLVEFDSLKDIDFLIHCAFSEFSDHNRDSDLINLNAAENLIAECQGKNIKIIYLSTFSAHKNAKSHYGINKFELESLFKAAGHLVLRIGVVVSTDGGMFPHMLDTIRSSKVLPLISGGNQPMQFIDIECLCLVISKLIKYKGSFKEFNISSVDSIAMKKFYNKIENKLHIKRYHLYIPMWIMFLALKFTKLIGKELPFNRENLLGLKAMRHFETQDSLKELGVPAFFLQDVFQIFFSKTEK